MRLLGDGRVDSFSLVLNFKAECTFQLEEWPYLNVDDEKFVIDLQGHEYLLEMIPYFLVKMCYVVIS